MEKNKEMKSLGEKLKWLRLSHGYNQKDIAGTIGLSVTAYSKIERDATDPSVNRLKQLARLFDVKLSELLGEEDAAVKHTELELTRLREKLMFCQDQIADLQSKLISVFEQHMRRV